MQYNGTPDQFWDAHKQVIDGREYLVVKDYNGREWRMDREAFDEHTTNRRKKRAYRVGLLDNIFDIALNPDEVWLGRTDEDLGNNVKTLDNYVLIKHYKDQSIAVVFNAKGNEMSFKTWFPLRDKKVRSGLLVKGKKQ